MTDTTSAAPSDAEIEALAAEHLKSFAQFSGAGDVWVEGEVAFARAVLAKWGVLRAEKIVIQTDTMEQEFQNHYRRGYEAGRKSAAAARQSAKAQPVARVPLTDEQIKDEASYHGFIGSTDQLIKFVRGIEAAHGIGTEKGDGDGTE